MKKRIALALTVLAVLALPISADVVCIETMIPGTDICDAICYFTDESGNPQGWIEYKC